MDILISVDPLTDLISDFLRRELDYWEALPPSIVATAVEFFNTNGVEAAGDSIVETFRKRGLWTADNARAIDTIVESFSQTFNLCKVQQGNKVVITYDDVSNTALVETVAVIVRDDAYLDNLKGDYRHACERNDFFPERLRRAFEEISR